MLATRAFAEDDADRLEGRWGVPVALEMLREHLVSPLDFLGFCQEAATASARLASTPASGAQTPAQQ